MSSNSTKDTQCVVILLSVYKGERYLGAQLESILAQEGVDVRVIVRDDGSPDDGATLAVAQKYALENPERIHVVHGENLGFAESFSLLVRLGLSMYPEAEWFAFADQDDVWLPGKLSRAVSVLEKEPSDIPAGYCSNAMRTDEGLNPIGMSWEAGGVRLCKESALIQSYAIGCTMVFNRCAAEMYDRHRPADVRLHDFLMYQICVFLGVLRWDPESFILYRQHSSNQIGHPNAIGRMKNRLKGHFAEHVLERQNEMLLEAYGDFMTVGDRELLRRFTQYRKSWTATLRLLFDRRIRYQSRERDFFYRLKILMRCV